MINEAASYYENPTRTLRQRMALVNPTKVSLRSHLHWAQRTRKDWSYIHIKRLEKSEITPNRTAVRRIAFQFVEVVTVHA